MTGFENAFANTEAAAAATAKSAADVARLARALEKAAKTGNISALRRARTELNSALGGLAQEVDNATQAWPFQPSEEEAYLKEGFAGELRQVAASQGLDIYQQDERLVAHPAIVRILPAARAVRVDRKQASTIRPSHLAALLLANQQKPSKFSGQNFLEAVHSAYKMLTGGQSSLGRNQAPVVPLENIYASLTLMPGSGRDYSRIDFARDLYRLDTEGPHQTRSGARIQFHSGRRSNISFAAPDGHQLTYYNVTFLEANNG